MAKTAALSTDVLHALEQLLGIELNTVRRVVIDIKSGDCPIVYTELFGDESKLLTVIEAMSSVEIERR